MASNNTDKTLAAQDLAYKTIDAYRAMRFNDAKRFKKQLEALIGASQARYLMDDLEQSY